MKQITDQLLAFASLVTLLLVSAGLVAKTEDKNVLMVVSGYGQQQGEKTPGYEFDEFAKAYLVFKQQGLAVDVASPKGGAVEADKFDPEKPYNQQVLQDAEIMARLSNTLAIADLSASQYDAIFIVGGKGAMFDLPDNTPLQKLIAEIYQQQGTVAAVCHGPAALVNVTLDDGRYLVADKAVNSFTNEEEQLFGKKWLAEFPFMLEDKLVERGARFQSSPIMLGHVAVDNRLITGQNPTSTVAVAKELLKSLGLDVETDSPYKDDRTLALVAEFLNGDKQAMQAIASAPEAYHTELVGMYGFYYLKIADSDSELQQALALMLLAQHAIDNPALDMQIAQTQHKLGDKAAATATLQQILASKPDYAPAQKLLKAL